MLVILLNFSEFLFDDDKPGQGEEPLSLRPLVWDSHDTQETSQTMQ